MDVLLEDDILQYCFSAAEEQLKRIDRAEASAARPARILPTFELCRAVHFGARDYHLDPVLFRQCWEALVVHHWERADAGFLLHVAPGEDEDHDLLRAIAALGPAASSILEEGDDPRDASAAHPAMTDRIRQLHYLAWEYLEEIDEPQRAWRCEPPDTLPTLDSVLIASDDSLVLDANYLLELLNKLPLDGRWGGILSLPDRIPQTIVRRFRHLLETYGAAGKLIVPICALEEALRVASQKDHHNKYSQARGVVGEMTMNPDMPLWNAFSIEPLSVLVFDAFLVLHEELVEGEIDMAQWPDFGDALVLAHGLYHGCPVASAEWIEKHEWDAVGTLYRHLIIR